MTKPLKDRILDNFAEDLMAIAEPWFIVTSYVPRCVGNFTHATGRWLYGKGMVLRDRNEEWLQIDKQVHDEHHS